MVDADVDSVWNALPDYERLADFIPNHIFRCYLLKPYILDQFQKIPAKNVSKSGLKLLIRGNAGVFIDD
ncbi:hypothetical protein L1887_20483 [Cichorium endivia]|nr:hypothetical protein L1887_20483 [Cichorium endivia]